jgi:osmoprotectant transport system substrate-binding protein
VRRYPLVIAGFALPLALAACGSSTTGKNGANVPSKSSASAATAATAATCDAVAGDELVVLSDDKHLQSSDNITPVVRTEVAKEPLTTVLNAVSAALSQDALLKINQASDIQHVSADVIASGFITATKISGTGGSGKVSVVAAGFSESTTLATIYAKALTAAGYDASVKQSTNREAYLPALLKGEVQVVPEYAATLALFLDKTAKTSGDVSATIAALKPLAEAKGLTVLNPAEATDQNAYAVTTAFAKKYSVSTLSDLATACPGGISLGGPSELETRPYGEVGLKDTYGIKVSGFSTYDTGGPLTKNALKQGKVALGLVFSSDSGLTAAAAAG